MDWGTVMASSGILGSMLLIIGKLAKSWLEARFTGLEDTISGTNANVERNRTEILENRKETKKNRKIIGELNTKVAVLDTHRVHAAQQQKTAEARSAVAEHKNQQIVPEPTSTK